MAKGLEVFAGDEVFAGNALRLLLELRFERPNISFKFGHLCVKAFVLRAQVVELI